ncbi:Uncharacterised protein [Staphylococcus aureus]|nr:Uncharacterised protein [Staphylococcus aureus]
MKVIEKVHYEDILESKIVRLFQAFIKDKMDQLFITSEHFAIDIDKLLFQLNLNVVNSGLKMLFYGGLKMSFFSGLRLSYI